MAVEVEKIPERRDVWLRAAGSGEKLALGGATLLAAFGSVFYLAFFARIIASGEVFHRLGFDWSMFWAQAMVLREKGGAALYDVPSMNPFVHQLGAYYRIRVDANLAQPAPYPPWFAALMEPFTFVPPPVGLALWYAVNAVALVFLAYRVRQFVPRLGFVGSLPLMLAAIPVATDLYMGQVALLLAVPTGEMLVSFKARRDFRAGLWLAVLLIKPQYAVLFGLLILWKLRWRAMAGGIVGTIGFVLLGLLAGGVTPFVEFPAALRSMADFQGSIGGPYWMINWRPIVLWLSPHISDQLGLAVVLALSVLTMLVALAPWRGAWHEEAPDFAPRFCLLTLGALISSYHSHLHGAALLIVPLAAAWSIPTVQWLPRLTLAAALYVPTVLLMWTAGVQRGLVIPSNTDVELWYVWPGVLPAALFIAAFGLMTLNLLGVRLPGLQLQLREHLQGRRAALAGAGAAGVIVIGVLLSGVVVARVRAREALPNGFTSRNLALAPVVRGLTEPSFVVGAADGTKRLFIVQRGGQVRVADATGELRRQPLLDLSEQIASNNEGGLLGLALDPQFAQNGYVYVAYTALDWSLQVVRYSRKSDDPDVVDASTAHPIISIPKQSLYDNGGMLAFGPDGYLYIGVGDDQNSDGAQDLGLWTGKILRVDVDSADTYLVPPSNPFVAGHSRAGARPEIWAYGLHNPARFSFDRATGDLWIGDVHHVDEGAGPQGSRESVEVIPANSPGGENFGFPAHFFGCADVANCQPAGVTPPVVEYDHNMNCAVTGGYVYRGSAAPGLDGAYIFGDYCTGGVFAVHGSADTGWSPRLELGYQPIKISSFGQDAAGELYVVDGQGGTIYRVTSGALPESS